LIFLAFFRFKLIAVSTSPSPASGLRFLVLMRLGFVGLLMPAGRGAATTAPSANGTGALSPPVMVASLAAGDDAGIDAPASLSASAMVLLQEYGY